MEAVTPEDLAFMEFLNFRDKVILVVNKADNIRQEQNALSFYEHGYSDVVAVSAVHGSNIDELVDLVDKRLPYWDGDEEKPEQVIRLAILGKPNTGKSTLLNRLTGEERSIVSDIPGTTRDIVEGVFTYRGRKFKVLDTAGIRRKSRVGENIEYYSVNRAIAAIDESDVVFLMIDAKEGLAEQDKKIADQIIKKGRALYWCLTNGMLLSRFQTCSGLWKTG